MKTISEELLQSPLGRTLKKALDTVSALPLLAEPLFNMQEQMLPRIRSRQLAFTPCDEALAVFENDGSAPHVISLARSHNWYDAALPKDFKPQGEYTADDLRREAANQLKTRQGIDARDDQFEVASLSTFAMTRAIIRTTKPGGVILGDTIAWDGYSIPPAMEQRLFMTKPEGESWRDYIKQHFANPKIEIGAIFITSPDSLTGRYTDAAVLKDLLDIATEFDLKLVLNQVHATPDANGKLPQVQTDIIAASRNPNLVLMTSATKQMMPYAVQGLENAMFNIFYSPDAGTLADIKAQAASALTPAFNGSLVTPNIIGPAVELMKASNTDFYAANQRKSLEKRNVVQGWLDRHEGVNWYNGQKPDTTYHAVLTFDAKLLGKSGVKSPQQLYDYILFSTGLDVAPIFDSGENGADMKGGVSMRMNYSLPARELDVTLKLLDVAVQKMAQGMTLDDIMQLSQRSSPLRLVADGSAPKPAVSHSAGAALKL